MTKRETAVLACRLCSIYGIFMFISWAGIMIQGGWSMFNLRPGSSGKEFLLFIIFVTPVILLLLFSIWIWRKADWLAGKMLPGAEVSTGESVLTASDLQVVAFSVVGLIAIVQALPQISSLVMEYKFRTEVSEGGQFPGGGFDRQVVFGSVKLLVGLGLLFGARGLAGILHSVRSAGTPKD